MNIPIPILIIPNFPSAVQIPHCNMHGSPNGIQGDIQSSGKSMSSSAVGGALGQSCSYLAFRGNVSLDWRPGTGLGGLGGGVVLC